MIRGGFGKYFAGIRDQWTHHTLYHTQVAVPEIRKDDRPNFTADPFNVAGGGHVPTFEEALRYRRDSPGGSVTADSAHTPYTYQSSIGLQRQIGQAMAVQAD